MTILHNSTGSNTDSRYDAAAARQPDPLDIGHAGRGRGETC